METEANEKGTPRIYRKAKGQIFVEGYVNLNDMEGIPIKHRNKFTLCGCAKC